MSLASSPTLNPPDEYRGGHSAASRSQAQRRDIAGAIRRLIGDHFIVFDLETQGERVIEVGLVRMTYGYIEAVESFLVDPGPEVFRPDEPTKRRRGNAELVFGAPPFAQSFDNLMVPFVLGHETFVGFSPANDRDHLTGEILRSDRSFPPLVLIDVRGLVKQARQQDTKLQSAYDLYCPNRWKQRHEALDDAVRTAHLLGWVCRDLVRAGARPENVETMRSRLGSAWTDSATLTSSVSPFIPKRRRPLPKVTVASDALRWAAQWRARTGLPPRVESGPDCPAPLLRGTPHSTDWFRVRQELRQHQEEAGFPGVAAPLVPEL